MSQHHDRRTMERLHQHLARAALELRGAQHVLDSGSAEAIEMDIAHDIAAASLAAANGLERVRARLGETQP